MINPRKKRIVGIVIVILLVFVLCGAIVFVNLVGPDGITVERKGRFGTNLPFLKDREIDTSYRTPYGTLPIHVATSRVVCLEVNGHINARADYRLTMEGGYDMDCSVMIRTDDY